MSTIEFMEKNYKHFNARETLAAAKEYHKFVTDDNGKMFLAMAGAMSTAEIGITLAPMIRAGKVSAISCTGANIEEDLFNLVANNSYKLQPDWRYLTMEQDEKTRDEGMNRVTDTCIPEDVMIEMSDALLELWSKAAEKGESKFHWEYIYDLIRTGFFRDKNDIPMEDSWVIAACEQNIPIYTPGVEDSTLGNMYCAYVMQGVVKSHSAMKSGTEQFEHLTNWYRETQKDHPIGFFQIGGGIAGDFAMCVVPSILQDHYLECRRWRYFCHIGDAVTSYGGYSGCPANEKVTWHKLDVDTPNFTINSDASIVAPLVFSYVMEKHLESTAEGIKDSVADETIGIAAGKKAVEAS
ncbi:MAG: deoxyhypusine synthase family protein [Candidatus Peribacteraceae bacterium]|nr:deoxyhypusine synthase family protein [Candidatus Peribacteraceae bacterium]MDP7477126.1 deoxyhypusine synthase family protein [Candidatus Peribacteraceae bacterium]